MVIAPSGSSRKITIFIDFMMKKHKGFIDATRLTQQEFGKLNDGTGKLNKSQTKNFSTMGRLWLGVRKLFSGFRGFRMEMLSVMFFGMGLNRFFMGLLNPSLKVAGVFEVLTALLQVAFLPIALQVLDWAIRLWDWWNNLSEGTKNLIGKMVLWGAILGGVLAVIGMVTLGIGGLLIAFGGLIKFGLILAGIVTLFGLMGRNVNAASDAGKAAGNVFTALWARLVQKFPILGEIWEKIKDTWDKVRAQIQESLFWIRQFLPTWFKTFINKITGLKWSEITDFFDNIKIKVKEVTKLISDFQLPAWLKIFSPQLLAVTGTVAATGAVAGTTAGLPPVVGAAIAVAIEAAIVNGFDKVLSSINIPTENLQLNVSLRGDSNLPNTVNEGGG